jgi:hypothetical protein
LVIERAVTTRLEQRQRVARVDAVHARRLRPSMALVVVTGVVLAAAGLAGYYSVRATTWAVMTDELQVARLATSIAESLSPVPTIHGAYYGAHSQLYPVLIAPFYGLLNAPAAATAAHALNALLLGSAACPAFLLACSVTGSRRAGYVAAALVSFTPWLALASTLLTENVAYPAFVWAVFLCQRALAAPSVGRDAAALAGLLLAFAARTQLFVLAVALPVALVIHELGFVPGHRGGSVRATVRRIVVQHRVLASTYLAGAAAIGAFAVAGVVGSVVGNYATPFQGDLLPPGFWRSAAAHFDQVAIGAGIVPVALAISWTLTTIARPERKEGHAYAALFLVLVPLLTFEVTSFDLRFTPQQFIQDRYLLYLVPLFAVGAAAWLVQRTRRTLRLATLVAAGGALATLVLFGTYDDPNVIFWASPAGAFHPALESLSGSVGLSTAAFCSLTSAALALVVAGAASRAPNLATIGVTLAVAGFGTLQAGYVLDRFVEPAMMRSHGGGPRDWIDAALPGDRSVALVPTAHDSPTHWWEAEFWNKNVDGVLKVGSGPTFTPFPADAVAIDYDAGRLRVSRRSDYLVVSESETRFRLFESSKVAKKGPLELVRARHPYRLAWATGGVTADGWTRARKLTTLRVYGHGSAGRRVLVVTLAASRLSRRPVDFVLRNGRSVRYGRVDPGGARPPVRFEVCVPRDSYAEVWLTSSESLRLPDSRVVGLHIDRLEVRDSGPCRPS